MRNKNKTDSNNNILVVKSKYFCNLIVLSLELDLKETDYNQRIEGIDIKNNN